MTNLKDERMAQTINSTMGLVYSNDLGECWKWGESYCVVHDDFRSWFSTNSMDVVDSYLKPKPKVKQLDLFG